MAEVVKYGVIADTSLFTQLESAADAILAGDRSELPSIITRCCQIKAGIVGEDERETTGRRAILNYGHTIGHALESVCGYGLLLHGEAVAIGMHCAAIMAANRRMVATDFVDRLRALLTAFYLPTSVPDVDHEALWAAIAKDKKTDDSGVRFILPTRLGEVQFVEGVTPQEVMAALLAAK
jgi:3-dehydroquinate synthase